jgi:uncharacterized protein
MHVTLHLTTACNLKCSYCYARPESKGIDMTREIIDKAIDFSMTEFKTNIGLVFFGGEPLLRKDLIKYAVERCKTIEYQQQPRPHFHFKLTTNGTLLDDDFIKFSKESGISIGLSIDGIEKAHDFSRIGRNGDGSFHIIEPKINRLLEIQPYIHAMMVITPDSLIYYAKSVEYLINRGFRYIIASMNYAGNWQPKHLNELKNQYQIISRLYKKWTFEQKKFYFSPFEMKLATHIRGNEDKCYTCQLSKRQISIAPDGKIYPCVQFVKDGISNTAYSIGDIWQGFDTQREVLFNQSVEEKETCKDCALKVRCYHTCSCLNYQTTGNINKVSPLLCETERILIPIVDQLGEELYKSRAAMFIQKHYNRSYPLLSMLEDELYINKEF